MIKRSLALVRGSIMGGLTYRTGTIMTIVGNLIYLVIIYFLWKAIYASSPTDVVNGMTFYDTLVYLVLASAMFQFMNSYVVWEMGRGYQTGEIVEFLVKPIDYQRYLFFCHMGNCIVSFCITFVPTFLVIYLVTGGGFALGWNLLYFILSLVFAIIISFFVDFFVGTICLHTQSIWGVNIMKEVIVSLLSGATIPLVFFPEKLQRGVDLLPFQAIYHIPLQMLTDDAMTVTEYTHGILLQLFWVFMMYGITRIFWKFSLRGLMVNGG